MKLLVLRDGQAISRETVIGYDLKAPVSYTIVAPPVGDGNPTSASSYLVVRVSDQREVFGGEWLLCQVALEFDALMVGRWHPVLIYMGKTDQPAGLVQFPPFDEYHGGTAPGDMHTFGVVFLP